MVIVNCGFAVIDDCRYGNSHGDDAVMIEGWQ
jgi:hypothetical protein